jgi:hypothetical protein
MLHQCIASVMPSVKEVCTRRGGCPGHMMLRRRGYPWLHGCSQAWPQLVRSGTSCRVGPGMTGCFKYTWCCIQHLQPAYLVHRHEPCLSLLSSHLVCHGCHAGWCGSWQCSNACTCAGALSYWHTHHGTWPEPGMPASCNGFEGTGRHLQGANACGSATRTST